MSTSLLSVSHVSKRYAERLAVNDLSFSIQKGEIVGFLGPNGAGKTTTMNMLAGFTTPSDGDIYLNGFSIQKEPETAKRLIGYLPETPPLYSDMTTCDYLQFCGRLRGLSRERLKSRLDFVITRCGLETVSTRVIQHLSKGFRQRIGIAQAIIADPDLIILDEPTVGLDPIQLLEIRTLIKDLGKDHTLILSTHILSEVTMTCGKILVIHEGKRVAENTYTDLANGAMQQAKTRKIRVRGTALDEKKLSRLSGLSGFVSTMPLHEEGNLAPALGRAFIVEALGDSDLETDILRYALEDTWGLKELTPYQTSLEELFLSLTQHEQEKPNSQAQERELS